MLAAKAMVVTIIRSPAVALVKKSCSNTSRGSACTRSGSSNTSSCGGKKMIVVVVVQA